MWIVLNFSWRMSCGWGLPKCSKNLEKKNMWTDKLLIYGVSILKSVKKSLFFTLFHILKILKIKKKDYDV